MTRGGTTQRKRYLIYGGGVAALLLVVLAMVSGVLARTDSQSASVSPDQAVDQPSAEPSASDAAEPDASTAPEQSAAAPAPPAPQATTSTGQTLSVETDTVIPSYQDVPVQESVTIQGTVTARIVTLTPTVSDGRGPGEIDGPALAVTVEVRNDSAETVDLNTTGVTLSLGPDMIPASPLPTQSLSAPFNGQLASGQSATGTYVFLVPDGSPQDLRIEVTYGGDKPLIVFSGSRP